MFSLLLSLILLVDSMPPVGSGQDVLPADTLKEVEVRPDSLLPVDHAIRDAIDSRLKQPKIPTISDVLEKLSPGLNDKVMHPFAFKQRKHERRMKRHLKVLEDYDRVKTFDELLREAYERQMLEDSLQKIGRKVIP